MLILSNRKKKKVKNVYHATFYSLRKQCPQTRQNKINPNNIQASPAAVDLHYMFNPVHVVIDTRINGWHAGIATAQAVRGNAIDRVVEHKRISRIAGTSAFILIPKISCTYHFGRKMFDQTHAKLPGLQRNIDIQNPTTHGTTLHRTIIMWQLIE